MIGIDQNFITDTVINIAFLRKEIDNKNNSCRIFFSRTSFSIEFPKKLSGFPIEKEYVTKIVDYDIFIRHRYQPHSKNRFISSFQWDILNIRNLAYIQFFFRIFFGQIKYRQVFIFASINRATYEIKTYNPKNNKRHEFHI